MCNHLPCTERHMAVCLLWLKVSTLRSNCSTVWGFGDKMFVLRECAVVKSSNGTHLPKKGGEFARKILVSFLADQGSVPGLPAGLENGTHAYSCSRRVRAQCTLKRCSLYWGRLVMSAIHDLREVTQYTHKKLIKRFYTFFFSQCTTVHM